MKRMNTKGLEHFSSATRHKSFKGTKGNTTARNIAKVEIEKEITHNCWINIETFCNI